MSLKTLCINIFEFSLATIFLAWLAVTTWIWITTWKYRYKLFLISHQYFIIRVFYLFMSRNVKSVTAPIKRNNVQLKTSLWLQPYDKKYRRKNNEEMRRNNLYKMYDTFRMSFKLLGTFYYCWKSNLFLIKIFKSLDEPLTYCQTPFSLVIVR